MAYKRELIVNNGSLTSYKKLLKVSDVCQLLDKREYPETTTVNGVTYTNNGDGTFTISGSATDTNFYRIGNVPLIVTHLYYMGHTSYTGRYCKMEIHNGVRQIDSYDNGIILTCEQTTESSVYIDTYEGEEFNIVYKPQLFDLTEMYGSGHEPTTVDEFKAKFPNELYDYSPRCWVKSYKTGLIAQTKNLFDSNNINKSYLGITYKTVSNGKILLNGTKEAGYNIYAVTTPNITLPAGTYTLSCRMLAGNIEGYDITFNRWIFFGINGSSTTYRCGGVGKVGDYETQTFTLTEDTLLSSFDITAGYTGGFSINNVIIECQLEKGTTATDYVPYGYL